MKTYCHLVPFVAAALVACGSTTATIDVDARPDFAGTLEALVHRPDGTQVSRVPIAGASLELPIEDGDTVTVVVHDGVWLAMRSYTGVDRGDTLTAVTWSSAELHSVPLVLPDEPRADGWEVNTPYGWLEPDSNYMIDVPVGATTTPIIAVGSSGVDVVGVYGSRAAPITSSGVAISENIAWKPTTVAISGVTEDDTAFAYGALAIGEDYLSIPSYDNVVPVPTTLADTIEVGALAYVIATRTLLRSSAISRAAPADNLAFDLSVPALPVVTDVQITSSTARWTATGGGDFDVVDVLLSGETYDWHIAASGGTTEIRMPTMPTDLAPPGAMTSRVRVEDLSDYDGYHAFIGYTGPRDDVERRLFRSVRADQTSMLAATSPRRALPPNAIVAGAER